MISDDDRRQLYRRGLTIRGVTAGVALVFFIAVWLVGLRPKMPGLPYLVAISILLIIVNPVMWRIGGGREFAIGDFRWHWALDILAVTGIVHYFGLFDIPVIVSLYMIMVVSSATFRSARTAMWLAHWSSAALMGLVAAEESGWLPHRHLDFGDDLTVEGKLVTAAGSVVLFHVFGYLAGTVASQLRERTEQAEKESRAAESAYRKEQDAKDRLVLLSALVQHDIYNPVSAISGVCKLASEKCDEGDLDEVRRFVRIIDDRIRSIEAAADTLGMFGEHIGEAPDFELRDIVVDLADELDGECRTRGVNLEIIGPWPRLRLPRKEVYHVLRNLATNAIKAVDDGGRGRVTIRALARGDKNGLGIEVIDNGVGVSEQLTELLNKPSLRKLGPRKPTGGFGAGLALSSNVVRGWGGTLECRRSEGGIGSTFAVVLPQGVATWDDEALRVIQAGHDRGDGGG